MEEIFVWTVSDVIGLLMLGAIVITVTLASIADFIKSKFKKWGRK